MANARHSAELHVEMLSRTARLQKVRLRTYGKRIGFKGKSAGGSSATRSRSPPAFTAGAAFAQKPVAAYSSR
jgi:hypothetical protein